MKIEQLKSGYNTEIALVLLCCRVYLGTEQLPALEAFIRDSKIDWKKVYQLSSVHRIRPVIYKTLTACKDVLNEAVLAPFKHFCFGYTSVTFSKKIESDRIIKMLQQNGHKVKLYKGSDLALLAYHDIAIRESADIDVIIEAKAAPAIIHLMEKEGYEMKEKVFYTRFPERFLRRHKDLVFQKNNFAFEFHFDPVMYFSPQVPAFVEMLGEDYLSPSRQYSVSDYFNLMIVNNGVADYYPDLRSVLDNAVLYQQLTPLEKQAITKSSNPFVQLWCYLAEQLFQLPCEALSFKSGTISKYTLRHILHLQEKKRKRMLFIRYSYFNILYSRGLFSKWKQVYRSVHFLLTPNGNDIKEGKWPFIAYYFTKPFRLLNNFFLGIFSPSLSK